MILACLGVALCQCLNILNWDLDYLMRLIGGDRFTDHNEQKKLHNVLLYTEDALGWSVATIRGQLKQSWEWKE
jgi:hypothetical protein